MKASSGVPRMLRRRGGRIVCARPERLSSRSGQSVRSNRWARGPPGGSARIGSVLAVQPDQLALNFHAVRRQDAPFIGRVGGLERDRGAAAAEALQRCFLVVDQRHHDVAGIGALVALNQRHVAVKDAGLDHGIPAYFERVMLARAEHVRRYADSMAAGLQRLDRRAGRDATHHRYRDGTFALVRGQAGARTHLAEIALDDARREAAAAAGGCLELRQLDDFNRTSAVGQASDEATLLERRDQAMDARLRAQVERILHLVEGGRYAAFLQTFTDEPQKLVLFAR